jgi:20S proteasome alpha/beta subunit
MSIIIAKITQETIEAMCDGYRFKDEEVVANNVEKIIKINDDIIVGGVGMSFLLDVFKDYCHYNSSLLTTGKINRDFLSNFVNAFLSDFSTRYSKIKILDSDLILITKKGIFSYSVYEDMRFSPAKYDGCNKLAIGIGSDYANALLDIGMDVETVMNKCLEKYPSLGGKITKIKTFK